MQTSKYSIFYPGYSDQALARDDMALMASSVDAALTNQAQSEGEHKNELNKRISDTNTNVAGVKQSLKNEIGYRHTADKALAESINAHIERDTGWIELKINDEPYANHAPFVHGKMPFLHIRRTGNVVFIRGWYKIDRDPKTANEKALIRVPVGFQSYSTYGMGSDNHFFAYEGLLKTPGGKGVAGVAYNVEKQNIEMVEADNKDPWWGFKSGGAFAISWPCDQAWPTHMPGPKKSDSIEKVGANSSQYTLESIKALLDEHVKKLDEKVSNEAKARLAAIAKEAGERATADKKLESKVSSVEASIDAFLKEKLYDLRADVSEHMRHQLDHGGGFNVVYAGSSTAQGYGSNGSGLKYDGRSWVERVHNAMAATTLVENYDAKAKVEAPPTKGIVGYNTAFGGSVSNTYMTSTRIGQMSVAKPAFMFHGIGSNNYSRQWLISNFQKEMKYVLDSLDKVTPNTKHIFVSYQTANNIMHNTPLHEWWRYNNVLKQFAAERPNVYYLDLSTWTWTMGMPGNNHWDMYHTDSTHVVSRAHKIYADGVLEALGLPKPPDYPELFNWPGFHGDHHGPGSSVAFLDLEKRPWPRDIVTSGTVFMRKEDAGEFVTLGLEDDHEKRSFYGVVSAPNKAPVSVPLYHKFFLPAHTKAKIAMRSFGKEYVSTRPDFSGLVTYAYMA